MSDFITFKEALRVQFKKMEKTGLYRVNIERDELWDMYMASFPSGTNNIFRERREYDCSCCRSFIKAVGGLVTIDSNNQLVSLFDVTVPSYYQTVADKMAEVVKSAQIADIFMHFEGSAGTDRNNELLPDGTVKTWEHFQITLPSKYVKQGADIASFINGPRTDQQVLLRSLSEITLDSAETVKELIAQGSLYRGNEHSQTVKDFVKYKKQFNKLEGKTAKANFCWKLSEKLKGASRIRNTVIGTLLTDLSEGRDLEAAVGSFEAKVAPTNYKRPKALVTESMIKKAQQTIVDIGAMDSLPRRHARPTDITINNVLFANRESKAIMNAFDEMVAESKTTPKNLDKVEEISIDDFISNVVPTADSIEVLLEGKHQNNLMSLIAPVNQDSKNILKWDNNFTWSYRGEVTDSIKERVKAAGGNVEGDLVISLGWFNSDDLDIHIQEPNGNKIYHGSKRSSYTGGTLDVDMNAGGRMNKVDPVENVCWPTASRLMEGDYQVKVNQYSKRNTGDYGFDLRIDYKGEVLNFHYPKSQRNGEMITAVIFNYSNKDGFKIVKTLSGLESSSSSKEVYGINTNNFQKVNMIMNSPNHWDGQEVGNKHTFFIIDGCDNDDDVRGFYNEFLSNDLNDHRKVFEVLASKMKPEYSTEQLSGLGFSETQRNQVIFKVTGSFTRTLKVNFNRRFIMTTNIYQKAAQMKLRFDTTRGRISVEDLYDLPLQSSKNPSLDGIAIAISKKLKETSTESFVQEITSVDQELTLQLDIVKEVIKFKQDQNKSRADAATKKAKRDQLIGLLAKKQDEALGSLSVEEIEAQLAAL